MRALWSFWSLPYRKNSVGGSSWGGEYYHLLAWVLSFRLAQKHFADTALVTDDEGMRLLVDGLGLEFDQVSTSLNILHSHDPEWWALGKLYAYREQREPFVHIDCDVYLEQPLPDSFLAAPVFAQHPEDFVIGASCYRPELFEVALLQARTGWLPPEWIWYRTNDRPQRGINCGILGGQSASFLALYADQAIKLIEHPGNAASWPLVGLPSGHMFVPEQYLLSACLEYHREHSKDRFGDLYLSYLFETADAFYDGRDREDRGFQHLIGSAKRDRKNREMLERRVMEDWPEDCERCKELIIDKNYHEKKNK